MTEPIDGPAIDAGNPTPGVGDVGDLDLDLRTVNWRDGIEKEWAEHGSMSNFESSNDLAKSYVNLVKFNSSANKVAIPAKEDVEGWGKLYDTLGRPSDPEAYDLGAPEGAPEGWNSEGFKDYTKEYGKTAREAGLTVDQTKALWNLTQNKALESYNKQTQVGTAALTKLDEVNLKEFGSALENSIETRNLMIEKHGGEEMLNEVKNSPALNKNTALIKMMNSIAKDYGEDKITDPTKSISNKLTPAEAASKRNAMLMDDNSPMYNEEHPEYKTAIKEYRRLNKMANAGQS